jgi:hypothetical protein
MRKCFESSHVFAHSVHVCIVFFAANICFCVRVLFCSYSFFSSPVSCAHFSPHAHFRVARAHAAGADIKEMAPVQFAAAYQTNMLAHWDNVTAIRKPIIAAVNGFALGGGCVCIFSDKYVSADVASLVAVNDISSFLIRIVGGVWRFLRAISFVFATRSLRRPCVCTSTTHSA